MTDPDTSLNAGRRHRELQALHDDPQVDVLVVGAGVTGAGAALDAASRGLSVALVDRDDLAFGTSRWSSKLVHGGLRYLANGQFAIAHESARERDILMRRTAPHLVRALPMLVPVHAGTGFARVAATRVGTAMGDVLRVAAGTGTDTLPHSRSIGRERTRRLVPGVSQDGLYGGIVSFDGQLTDDARLVLALARTAAGHGARVITRCAAERLDGGSATLRDRLTGESLELRAGAVINATGVYAGDLVPDVRLRPSRGTHIVLPSEALGNPAAALTIPVPGSINRFVFALPQPDGRVFAGLTDEPVEGPVPEVPEPPETDVAFLLDVVNSALATRLTRADVLGAYAGLRPLLDTGSGNSADVSRRHAILTSPDGTITAVGGKLTTYRRMAREAVDAAVSNSRLLAGPSRTATLPLVGATGPRGLAAVRAPRRLVERYGTEATAVLAQADGDPEALTGLARGITPAELRFAVRHEGALDTDDLLERRTRLGLVASDRQAALAAAEEALGH
ncbi:glycerol-3-phosphate dehydrogenase [Haloactinospora alba]|uniref:Glycerol-3-phosphate dehydrogenase n=1 Tax=Haloactinospora alba TaxID=405555 RepID=A0A543NLH9_9ACTN|nr:glycerol-3-phosphate dehydrogenase/oxidase [Haloactinospora alba]TQN32703.1 glycerol-3-phosphate dehydrogenase [Haloactinospora alba]